MDLVVFRTQAGKFSIFIELKITLPVIIVRFDLE
jgi:hypothetical protein